MNSDAVIHRLEAQARVIEALVTAASDEQARWKPSQEAWSVLEVTAHLLDEEREDFRIRLGLLLSDPSAAWPGIDPAGWVVSRAYGTWNLTETLRMFLAERADSLAWLQALEAPCWENAKSHPAAGTLHAGDILSSWVAHDLLHIRQLNRLAYQWIVRLADPYSPDYAGGW